MMRQKNNVLHKNEEARKNRKKTSQAQKLKIRVPKRDVAKTVNNKNISLENIPFEKHQKRSEEVRNVDRPHYYKYRKRSQVYFDIF